MIVRAWAAGQKRNTNNTQRETSRESTGGEAGQDVQLGVFPRAGVASDQRSGAGLSLMSFLIALIKICLLAIFADYCT
jgi:hypothetical protein